VNISANAVSRFITFRVSKASLGTPAPGWGLTVVLTGQDGFSSDQARGFQPTPQEFQFGRVRARRHRADLRRSTRTRCRRRST
jgi:glucoamylase